MNKGFTLLEMIVAIGIFSLVVIIALGSLLNISNIQQKAEAFRIINNNLNFALDLMSREIQMGFNYDVTGSSINFDFGVGEPVKITYSLSDDQIQRSKEGDPYTYVITDSRIKIENLKFILRETNQPMVIITIDGSVSINKINRHFNLQTTVNQRK